MNKFIKSNLAKVLLLALFLIIISVIAFNFSSKNKPSSSQEKIASWDGFGKVKSYRKQDGKNLITVGKMLYENNIEYTNNYSIYDLKSEEEFRVSPDAKITVTGDALTDLSERGIVDDPQSLKNVRQLSFLFTDFIKKIEDAGLGFNDLYLSNMFFEFKINDKLITDIYQYSFP